MAGEIVPAELSGVIRKQLEAAESGLDQLTREYLHLRGVWEGRIAALRDLTASLIESHASPRDHQESPDG